MNFLKVVDKAALDVDVDFVESYLKYFTFTLECFRIFFTDPDIILILHFSIKAFLSFNLFYHFDSRVYCDLYKYPKKNRHKTGLVQILENSKVV